MRTRTCFVSLSQQTCYALHPYAWWCWLRPATQVRVLTCPDVFFSMMFHDKILLYIYIYIFGQTELKQRSSSFSSEEAVLRIHNWIPKNQALVRMSLRSQLWKILCQCVCTKIPNFFRKLLIIRSFGTKKPLARPFFTEIFKWANSERSNQIDSALKSCLKWRYNFLCLKSQISCPIKFYHKTLKNEIFQSFYDWRCGYFTSISNLKFVSGNFHKLFR